jgi:hypothetical protein
MSIKCSKGYSKKVLEGNPIATIFGGGSIVVFSGTVPTTAEAETTGCVPEWIITKTNGTPSGLTFDAVAAGARALLKASADTWGGTIPAVGGGTPAPATFFRIIEAGDTATANVWPASDTLARIQGTVGAIGELADFTVASTTFVAGTKNLSAFSITVPE